jgi:hypothetical protein
MKNNRFTFYSGNGNTESDGAYVGCSSFGFSTKQQWISPTEKGYAVWDHELPGEVLTGSYENVIQSLSTLSFPLQLGIVLYKRPAGFEDFLSRVINQHPGASFIGGGAAFFDGMQEGIVKPDGADVWVFASSIQNFRIEKQNIFEAVDIEVEIKPHSARRVDQIREVPDGEWQDAVTYFRKKQTEYQLGENNFENLCFCDKNRRNLHSSISDEKFFVGANLPEDNHLYLNYISCERATEKLENFFDDKDSLIFGCAGIRSLIQKPVFVGERSLAGFMFGEVVTCGEKAELGNLMLVKLKISN